MALVPVSPPREIDDRSGRPRRRQNYFTPMSAEAVLNRAKDLDVSERTLMIAKKNLGVISEKQGNQWYWRLPEQGCKDVTG